MENNTAQQTAPLIRVTDATFQKEVLDASNEMPVFIDVYADWCTPCRMVAPIVEKLSKDYAGKVKFVKLDSDVNPEIVAKFGIMSIPMLMVFVKGEMTFGQPGALNETMMKDVVDTFGVNKFSAPAQASAPADLPKAA